MTKMFALALTVMAFAIQPGLAQSGNPPKRPPWGDVCCGGPCCVKPPGR